MKTISVNQTWDGQSLSKEEWLIWQIQEGNTALTLKVSAPFYKNPAPLNAVGSTESLWEYEVAEIFFALGDHYTEIELSPYGHFLVLRFEGVRQRVSGHHQIEYDANILGQTWSGEAQIPYALLPSRPWGVNAYGIHTVQNKQIYKQAFRAPLSEPDFHHLSSFRPFNEL